MVAKECRDEVEKTKAHLKLGPVVNVKNKTKDFRNAKMQQSEGRGKLLIWVLST